MRIAITGSTGLIGSALVDHLRARDHDVVRIVRTAGADRSSVSWSPADGTIDATGLEGVHAVVHLAGAGIADRRWSDERKRIILESRTRSTDLLARTLAGLSEPPSVLVSASAIGFYGDRGDERLDEQSSPGNDFLADVCGAWECAADPAREAGIRTVHPRTGIVLTSRGGALAKQLPLFKLGLGGRLGSGDQWMSWISLEDELHALEHLVTADVHGPVNLTAPQPVTNADFTDALGQALGRPTFLPVPAFGPKLLLGPELAQGLLFNSARVLPARLEESGYDFRHTDISAALAAVLE